MKNNYSENGNQTLDVAVDHHHVGGNYRRGSQPAKQIFNLQASASEWHENGKTFHSLPHKSYPLNRRLHNLTDKQTSESTERQREGEKL